MPIVSERALRVGFDLGQLPDPQRRRLGGECLADPRAGFAGELHRRRQLARASDVGLPSEAFELAPQAAAPRLGTVQRGGEPLELSAAAGRRRVHHRVLDAGATGEGDAHDVEERGEGMTPRLARLPSLDLQLDVGVDETGGAERGTTRQPTSGGSGESRRGGSDRCSDADGGEHHCVADLVEAVLLAGPVEHGEVGELLRDGSAGERAGPDVATRGGDSSVAPGATAARAARRPPRRAVAVPDTSRGRSRAARGRSPAATAADDHRPLRSSRSSLGETSGRESSIMPHTADPKRSRMTASAN